MSSKNIYMPYFYIIRHKETGKKYAGARWAANCHPNEFMQPNGYTTSSTTINSIIEERGIDIFDVEDIITLEEINIPFGTNSIYEYESWFLVSNNCAKSQNWYNGHNNFGMAFGLESFYVKAKQTYIDVYGVDNPFKAEDVKETIKRTHNKNLGVDYPMQSDVVKKKSKVSCMEKYGYEFTGQVPEIREKQTKTRLLKNNGKYFSEEAILARDATCMEKYGVKNVMQLPETVIKSKTSRLEKYNDENYTNLDKTKKTKLERYGNENYNNLDKNIETCLNKYGVGCVFESEEIKQKIVATNIEKFGVRYQSEIKIQCPHCNKIGAKPSMMRWHFDNCKLK